MKSTSLEIISRALCVVALSGAAFAQIGTTHVVNGIRNVPNATGTAQAQVVTISPTVTSLTNGLSLCFIPVAANTAAAPTLAVNGLTATSITRPDGTALVAGDLSAGTYPACVIYESSHFLLSDPLMVGGTSATPGVCMAVTGSTVSLSPSAVLTSSSTVTFGAEWATQPCAVAVGGYQAEILNAAQPVIISSGTSGDTGYLVASPSGLQWEYGSANNYLCPIGIACVSGVAATSPPPAGTLWTVTVTAGSPATFTALTPNISTIDIGNYIEAGPGLQASTAFGVQTIVTDPSVTPRYFTGSVSPGGSCTYARDFYTQGTTGIFFCGSDNAWHALGGSGGATKYAVQGCTASSAGASSLPCTLLANITAGDDLYYWAFYGGSATVSFSGDAGSCTPDPGATTPLTNVEIDAPDGTFLTACYKTSATGGAATITVSGLSSQYVTMGVLEFRGASSLDKADDGLFTASSVGAAGAVPLSNSITTTNAGDICLGLEYLDGAGNPTNLLFPGTNVLWVAAPGTQNIDSGTGYVTLMQDYIQPAAGSIFSTAFTVAGSRNNWGHIACFH